MNATLESSLDAPLVVDLDGTLIRSDMLAESFLRLAVASPWRAGRALPALGRGKAALKAEIASRQAMDVDSLPFNEDVLALIAVRRDAGGAVWLASASNRRYVQAVADHLGLFDGVFASDDAVNLSGPAKASALVAAFGDRGFDYVGDAAADLPVWACCRQALVIGASGGVERRLAVLRPDYQRLGGRPGLGRAAIRALRPHQWLKNLLVFVPPLAGHAFDARFLQAAVAFVAFSLTASSVYLLNDLADLPSDRRHPRKRLRSLASGALPIAVGAALAPPLLLAALGLALLLPVKFLLVLAAYYVLTLAYSFRLKRLMIADVVALACLYGARLAAGGAASNVPISTWLEALAIFLFLSLALVKRCAELQDRLDNNRGDPGGRGYRLADLPALQAMAASSGYISVLVLALYLNGDTVSRLYARPHALWLICVVMLYWISRVVLKTVRGEMHDDPVIFAATDPVSLACAGVAGAAVVAAMVL